MRLEMPTDDGGVDRKLPTRDRAGDDGAGVKI